MSPPVRLLLVRHGVTAETRRAAFPGTSGAWSAPECPPLDAAGVAQARALAARLPVADRCWSSLAARSVQTAELATGYSPELDPDLAECDFGAWAGHSTDEVYAVDPDGLARWHADPDSAPHGGERLTAVRGRAARVLQRCAALGGTTVAVTHGGLIKAALLEVLGLPSDSVWRLDAAPGSVTELHSTPTSTAWRVALLNWQPAPSGWHTPDDQAPDQSPPVPA